MSQEIQVGVAYEHILHGTVVSVFSVKGEEVTYEIEDQFGNLTAFVMPIWVFSASFKPHSS